MSINPPQLPDAFADSALFRIASLLLYSALLLHVALAAALAREPLLAAAGTPAAGAIAILALLFLVALMRYMRPAQVAQVAAGRNWIAFELLGVIAAIALLTLQPGVPIHPLSWLIGVAGVFPLALAAYPALAATAVAVIAASESMLNLMLDIPANSWLSCVFATLLAGLLSALLSKALRMNFAVVSQARAIDRRFNAIARATRHVFMITDGVLRVKYTNPALFDVLGYLPEEVENDIILASVHSEDLASHQEKLRFLRQRTGSRIFSRHRMRHKDGHWVWLETCGYNMLHDSAIGGLVFSLEDISARKEAERRLEQEHALLRAVLDLNPSMIYAKDTEGRFTISNASFQRRFGYSSEEELRGKTSYEVFQSQSLHGHDPENYRMADALHQQDMHVIMTGMPLENQEMQGFWGNDVRHWYRTDKYPLRDSSGNPIGILGITHDITERKEYEMRLEHQALHDPLTGLPNRRYLLLKIADFIDKAPAGKRRPTILFCDLDFFKNVNDTHGHDIGDKCLLEITRRIQAEIRPPEFIARFGGDEFVILINATPEQAGAKADVLLHSLAQPVVVADIIVKIQASIGIAQLTEDHKNPSDLIRDADAAMYQAKERGRNRAERFDASLQFRATRRAQLDVALRFALERNELELAYQPKISMVDGSLKGFELLLRWNSPQFGSIRPDEFIPVAEHSGQLIPIGMWALQQACHRMAAWKKAYPQTQDLVLAVNVSMRQLLQSSFVRDVAVILKQAGVAPQSIELELTETSAMANPRQTIETLSLLKKLGLRLALDDFGTGYSSLAYLQRLPIDVLKIDKAFVHGLGKNPSDAEIVRLILALARTLNLETVAEGVESVRQIAELTRLGCSLAQGFFFSPPVSAEEAEKLLARPPYFLVA